MKQYILSPQLEFVDKNNKHQEGINSTLYSALYNTVSARAIQQMIDSNKSSSRVKTQLVIQKWLADNGSNKIIIKKAINDLEMLVLTKNNIALLYIANFTDILGCL